MQLQPLIIRIQWIKEHLIRFVSFVKTISLRSGKSRHISDIIEKLTAFSNSIQTLCKASEPDFITLGNHLQKIDASTSSLTELTIKTLGIINAETGLLSRISAIAEESSMELQRRYTNVMANLEKVNTIVDYLSELYDLCGVIEKIAVFLRIIGLNMDIESSRSAESIEMFGVVAKEMKQLSETVIGISVKMKNSSNEAKIKQLAAHLEISKGIQHLKTFSDAAEHATKNAVTEIESFIGRIYQLLEKARDHSEIVTSQVSEIVMGIQLHDSITQRIDHIFKAIHDVKNQLTALQTRKEKHTADTLGAAFAVIQLQSEQLKHIIQEIEQGYEKNGAAFDRISNEAANLAQCLAMLMNSAAGEKNSHAKTDQDPFVFLKNTLMHLNELLEQGRNLITKIEETTHHASKETTQLLDLMNQLRSFSFNTHIIALNAIVKAAQIGETGATLEVLSQEMSKLSTQTNEFVESVENILVNINKTAEELHTMNKQAREIFPVGKARSNLESGLSDILDVYSRFQQSMADVLSHSEAVQSFISSIHSSLSFMPEAAGGLKDQLVFLETISKLLNQWATRHTGLSQIEFGKLTERYTMQKERDIHQKVFENTNSSIETAVIAESRELPLPAAKPSADKNSLGDNVEFF